ncbi:hypothetical protein F9L33_08140 [Amylibacter sp. SFDW26]|uniref:hypothetical protein n=1 Tax=Amylibacter sp. SFDW26 TaxID=2652722 RepID=UPI00126217C3|nr:hypothetical protein [Amylibacter sp. SFDW26]KAB7614597.1 hypothetical protein F9L33_08140 [Amylibacter sp. SFDW26]
MRLNDKALTFVTGLVLILGVGTFVHKGDELFKPKQQNVQVAKADISSSIKTDAIASKYNISMPLESVVLPTKPELEFDTGIQLVRADKPASTEAFEKLKTVLDYKSVPVDCKVKLSAKSLRSARVQLSVTAPCHSNEIITISHAGLRFNEYVDGGGVIIITIPVLSNPAEIEVSFDDGTKKSITTQAHDLSSYTRTGIAWSGHNSLNLQVLETAYNTEKNLHLTADNKRSEEKSYFLGGGYLTALGNTAIPNGEFIHIYTADITQKKYVDFQLHMKKQSLVCQNNLELKTIHYASDTNVQIAKKSATINHCMNQSENIVLKNMLRNMIVAQRN